MSGNDNGLDSLVVKAKYRSAGRSERHVFPESNVSDFRDPGVQVKWRIFLVAPSVMILYVRMYSIVCFEGRRYLLFRESSVTCR
jgi:hypothetical protein